MRYTILYSGRGKFALLILQEHLCCQTSFGVIGAADADYSYHEQRHQAEGML